MPCRPVAGTRPSSVAGRAAYAPQADRPSRSIRRECSSVRRANIRPSSARSAPARPGAPTRMLASASRSTPTRWAWVMASPTRRRPQSASRPGEARVGGDGLAHDGDREVGLTGVLEDADDERAGVLVDVARDLAVEVLGDALADVGLDESLEEVGGGRALVEGVDGRHEGLHGRLRLDAEGLEALGEHGVVLQLVGGEDGERRLVTQRRRELGVLGQLAEGTQLAVRERPEQVRDRSEVAGLVDALLEARTVRVDVEAGRRVVAHAPNLVTEFGRSARMPVDWA